MEAPSLQDIRSSLTDLILSNNYIKYLKGNYFQGCVQLLNVYLKNNFLLRMPDFSYIQNTVEIIDLQNNNIRQFGSLCDVTYNKLIGVGLGFNSIT